MNVSYLAHQTIRNEAVSNMVTFRNRRHMKLIQLIAIMVLMITLFIAGIHRFILPLSDWSVRIAHIVMLISLMFITFCTIKIRKGNQ